MLLFVIQSLQSGFLAVFFIGFDNEYVFDCIVIIAVKFMANMFFLNLF